MPHDRDGRLLQRGDVVDVRMEVKDLSTGEEACNVTLEALERPKGETYIPQMTGNSRFCRKAGYVDLQFLLGQRVRITVNGLPAKVIGVWLAVSAQVKYLCQYADSTGRLAEDWLLGDQLEPLNDTPAAEPAKTD